MRTNFYPTRGACVVIIDTPTFRQELYVNWDTGVSYIVTSDAQQRCIKLPETYTLIY